MNQRTKVLFIIILILISIIVFKSKTSIDLTYQNIQEQDIAIKSDNKLLIYEFKSNYSNPSAGIKLNSDGFRSSEFNLKKDPNTTRIAVVGDSITFGLYIKNQSNIFVEKLNSIQDNVEFLNFGVSGYSLMQEIILINNTVNTFDPDIVILVYTLNDIDEEYLFSIKQWFTNEEYEQRKKEKWEFLGFNQLCKIKWEYKNSAFYTGYKLLKGKLLPIRNFDRYWEKVWQSLYSDNCNRKSLDNSFKRLKILANDTPVVIVHHPLLYWDESYLQQPITDIIEDFALKYEFLFLDLTPEYMKYNSNDLRIVSQPKDKEHPNELGHQITANTIYDFLEKNKLI